MKRSVVFGIFFLLIAGGACLSVGTMAAEGAETIKVMSFGGSPKIMKAGTEDWSDVSAKMAVNSGDRIKTAQDEFVEIAFTRDIANVVKIAERSDVVVKSSNHIELLNGKVLSRIRKLAPQSTFEVKTPAGLCGARGTGWETEASGDRMEAAAFKDEIFMKGIDESGALKAEELIVEEGWRAGMDKFETPETIERVSDQEKERYNEWDKSVEEQSKGQEGAADTGGTTPPGGGAPPGGGTPPPGGGTPPGGGEPPSGGKGERGAATFGGGEGESGGGNVGGESIGEKGEKGETLTEREPSTFEKDSFEKDSFDRLDKVVEREEQTATRSEETSGTKTETVQREEEKTLINYPSTTSSGDTGGQ